MTETITCPDCAETFWVLGETTEARTRAVAEWAGCDCTERGAA